MPLPGYQGFSTIDNVLNSALQDLISLEQGGVDGIIVENNYDIPHKKKVGTETVAAMTFLTLELSKRTKLPLGVSVLWNDYEAAFSIAKVCRAKFIRIPAFVDDVITDYGRMNAVANESLKYRKKIKADDIAIFADVQVKHSEMVDKNKSLETSIKQAKKYKADAIIITGKWTGDAPNLSKLKKAKKSAEELPILIGSGTTKRNITELKKICDGVIIGTALKEGQIQKGETNLKKYSQRISAKKTQEFVAAFRKGD